MKNLPVYLDAHFHEDLKELAHRKKTTMSALIRYAVDKTFEDELDAIGAEGAWEEYLADPSAAISLDEYMKERGIGLPHRSRAKGSTRPRQVADEGAVYSV
jgi:hypothetical protein